MRGGSLLRLLSASAWSAFLAVSYGPLLGVLMVATDEAGHAGWNPLSPRRLGLLLKSLMFSAGVALSVMVVGVMAAIWLLRHPALARPGVQWLLLASVAVPPTVQALAWCQLLGELGRRWGLSLIGDWATAAVAQACSLFPFGTGLAMAALRSCDGRLLDAGRLQAAPLRLIGRLALPLARPLLLCGVVLVYLLSVLDYTLPSIFGVNVYAMEILVGFSANHSVAEALWLCLPVLLLSLALLASLVRLPQRLAQRPSARFPQDGALPRSVAWLFGAAVLATLFALGLPLLSLAGALANPGSLITTAITSTAHVLGTLQVSLVAALLAAVLAILPACVLAGAAAGRTGLWALVLLPYLLPPTLIGIGWLALRTTAAAGSEGGLLLVSAALASRLAPLAVLVLAAFLLRLDPALLEAALVSCRSRHQALGRILLPMMLPGVLAAGSLVFILSLGDVGTTLLLLPPGAESLAIKTYNYLHYGGSQAAAGLCLLLLALAFAVTALPWMLWWLQRTWHRRTWQGRASA